MKIRDLTAALGFTALGMVLMAAASSAGNFGGGADGRPQIVTRGCTVTTVDRQSGAENPISYTVEEADGPWLKVQLLKKSSKAKKGDAFWVKVDDLGAFIVE